MYFIFFFFFKQKTAYEIGTGDWSSDVCSSDLDPRGHVAARVMPINNFIAATEPLGDDAARVLAEEDRKSVV